MTLLEMLVVMGIIAVIGGIGVVSRQPQLFALRNAQSTLIADLRMARGSAIANAVHYRVEMIDAGTYEIRRMMELGNAWVPDGGAEVTRTFASTVSISVGAADGYEFNTRGILSDPTNPSTITLVDSATGHSRTVDVWPSGQVISGAAL